MKYSFINRLNNILTEARSYETMLEPIDQVLDAVDQIPLHDWYVKTKKEIHKMRRDLETWYTRYFRIVALQAFLNSPNFEVDDDTTVRLQMLLTKWKQLTNDGISNVSDENNMRGMSQLLNELEHFMSLDYFKIKNYRFENQNIKQIRNDLRELEEEYQSRARNKITHNEINGDKVIIDMNPFFWVYLNRASCSKEAKAMGHCGNSPRSATSDRILSLRELLPESSWVTEEDDILKYSSRLTFTLTDGYIVESKGGNNNKPSFRYHPYIIELLKNPIVKGIKGGGYKPENNFHMSDLENKDIAKELIEMKPALVSDMKERIAILGFSKSVIESIIEEWRSSRYSGDYQKYLYPIEAHYNKTIYPDITEDILEIIYKELPEAQYGFTEYFEKYGLSDYVMEIIHDTFINTGSKRLLNHNLRINFDDLPDREKIIAKYPDMMNTLDYYNKYGLDNSLIERIRGGTLHSRRYWFNNKNEDTLGFTVDILTDEEKHKLWRAIPNIMPFKEQYSLYGFTPLFKERILDIIDNKEFNDHRYYTEDFDLYSLTKEERFQIFEDRPDIMTAYDSFEKDGMTKDTLELFKIEIEKWIHDDQEKWWEQDGFNKLLDIDKSKIYDYVGFGDPEWISTNVTEDKQPEYYYNALLDISQEKLTLKDNVIIIKEWESVEDVADDLDLDNLKHYANDDWSWDNDYHSDIDDFDDYIPVRALISILKWANDIKKDADGLDEDEFEPFEDWGDIVKEKNNYDLDELFDVVERAATTAEKQGAADESYQAIISFFEQTPQIGKFIRWDANEENIKYVISDVKDMHEVVSTYPDWIYDGLSSQIKEWLDKKDLDVPYYGFYGFSDEAAQGEFMDNISEDICPRDTLSCPYNREMIEDMSPRDMITEYKKMISEADGIYRWKELKEDDDDLRFQFIKLVKRHYKKDFS